MKRPSFSVCIPNYNYAKYIGETIQSVLDQTYDDYEIIVVDNASTDDSVKVVEAFGSEKIRLFRNRVNVGFAPNLQRATEQAQKDFLLLLSSDDLMYPEALESYAGALERQGERAERTVLCSATDVIHATGELRWVLYRRPGQMFHDGVLPDLLHIMDLDGSLEVHRGVTVLRKSLELWRSPGTFCATCYPRSMWLEVGGYDVGYQMGPDTVFLHKLLSLDPDYGYVRKRLFRYRTHSTNQLSIQAAQGAIKSQVDGYLRTIAYSDALLAAAGLSRDALRQSFIEEICAKGTLRALADGNWLKALRIFSFGFATHPANALRTRTTLTAAGALVLGPVGEMLCRAVRQKRARDELQVMGAES
jgi:GT2 family glycosyltransferase